MEKAGYLAKSEFEFGDSQRAEGEALPPFNVFPIHVRPSYLPSPQTRHTTYSTRAPYTGRALTNSININRASLEESRIISTPPPRGKEKKTNSSQTVTTFGKSAKDILVQIQV